MDGSSIEHVQAGFSRRGWRNVQDIMPKIARAASERERPTTSAIDLSTAENWLARDLLVSLCKDTIRERLEPQHLSYTNGLAGDSQLLAALARLMNDRFNPVDVVLPAHIVTAPGAASCIDGLLHNICDVGDGILIPGPYWDGFDLTIRAVSSVEPILVSLDNFEDCFTENLVQALESTFEQSVIPVKALLLCNPHNPLGVCYPRSILESCIRFCARRSIHFISDEVYALTNFASPDLPQPTPFTSVLSLDLEALGVNPSQVHMIWSTSKDFGQSGVRLVRFKDPQCFYPKVSQLTSLFVTRLLSPDTLENILRLSSTRLCNAYIDLTELLKRKGIRYWPCNAGLYVWAKIAPDASSKTEEEDRMAALRRVGIQVSPGMSYHPPASEWGWARISFAIPTSALHEAISRLDSALD